MWYFLWFDTIIKLNTRGIKVHRMIYLTIIFEISDYYTEKNQQLVFCAVKT